MADVDSYTRQQQLLKEQHQANPSKYYKRFLYKALLLFIFSVVIQVFPSHAPEFIHQTLLNRNWELLHLLFVGIAVSYGLFSRRNDETEKEIYNNQSKSDSVQSLMSRFLQVDEEAESLSGSDDGKTQVWSSLYCRNQPPVIVAKQHSVLDENTSSCPRNPEKPLLLPVRSLKSRALNQASKGNRANSRSLSRSNSKRFSSKGTNGGLDQEVWVENWCENNNNNNNNVVLPSPIPWRSRSGRMEMKEDDEFGSLNIRLSRSNSMSSSPKLSHSPPLYSPKKSLAPPFLSMEAQAKSAEDFVRKKCIYKSPPPPPPPPPPMIQKPASLKPVSSSTCNEVSPWSFANGPSESKGSKGKSRKAGEVQTGMINGKAVRFDHQTSSRAEKLNRESVGFRRKPKPTSLELPQEEKRDIVEKVMVGTTNDDSEREGETPIVSSPNNEEGNPSSGNDGGSDVDKKADEFIAKVREQIRLQRIDSIKRSSVQFKRSATR